MNTQGVSFVTQDDRRLADEVIAKAAANYRAGIGPEDRLDFDYVLADRFPARGTGGVAMANRRTRGRIWAAILEFYQPVPTEY